METGTEKATTPGSLSGSAAGASPRLTLPGRNATKADVFVYSVGGRDVAVKDYGPRPWWIRHTVGRFLIARETRAYLAAGGAPGLVEFLGRTGPYSLSTRYVDAQPLFSEPSRFPAVPVDSACFDRLDKIVAGLHERGVALSDLHRRDVLVDRHGGVHVLDLATAWVSGPGAGRLRRWVFQRCRDADRVALARLRARGTGQDPSEAMAAVGGTAARWDRRFRRIRRLRDRVRGKKSATPHPEDPGAT